MRSDWWISNESCLGVAENGFVCSWLICVNQERSLAEEKVRQPNGAVRKERVVPLSKRISSKRISKGMIPKVSTDDQQRFERSGALEQFEKVQ